ncbi:alpha-2-HS-glycoprotein-like [Corythoichthys intestinalis]|uniref:alpha-2-HS-glycoprotein-like n=1 Tax=Corythoichthys intestinalis TaxID=161448 RepID=UPI0025A5C761|nr:alpha-2-HS-glycoprotein-like [Corythoichthys intestinalis]XP_061806814.1 alpha-2-HS-glycoprotein-like [Nerophis lumbriciformis]
MAVCPLAVLLFCALALPSLLATTLTPSSFNLTCGVDNVNVAASYAVKFINQHHKHGFKFKLREVQSSEYLRFSGACHIDLNLKLVQTKCHVTNPKPYQECGLWRREERGVLATCSVEFWVIRSMGKITKFDCDTRPEITNDEMPLICPSCPTLLPLDNRVGVSAVEQAVLRFNQISKHGHYFSLMEVAHLTSRKLVTIGTISWLKFALVETTCPREANTLEDCTPLCPDRAHHVFCQTEYYNAHNQVGELDCKMYPPKDSAPLPLGVGEPVCDLFHDSTEDCICKAKLRIAHPAIHHICPFPLQ